MAALEIAESVNTTCKLLFLSKFLMQKRNLALVEKFIEDVQEQKNLIF
jgi:hypothetical protein